MLERWSVAQHHDEPMAVVLDGLEVCKAIQGGSCQRLGIRSAPNDKNGSEDREETFHGLLQFVATVAGFRAQEMRLYEERPDDDRVGNLKLIAVTINEAVKIIREGVALLFVGHTRERLRCGC